MTPWKTFIREIISWKVRYKVGGMALARVTVAWMVGWIRFLRTFRLDKSFSPTACKLARGIPYALSRDPIDVHSAVSSMEIVLYRPACTSHSLRKRVFHQRGRTLMDSNEYFHLVRVAYYCRYYSYETIFPPRREKLVFWINTILTDFSDSVILTLSGLVTIIRPQICSHFCEI